MNRMYVQEKGQECLNCGQMECLIAGGQSLNLVLTSACVAMISSPFYVGHNDTIKCDF